jgi:hypothetical protein
MVAKLVIQAFRDYRKQDFEEFPLTESNEETSSTTVLFIVDMSLAWVAL